MNTGVPAAIFNDTVCITIIVFVESLCALTYIHVHCTNSVGGYFLSKIIFVEVPGAHTKAVFYHKTSAKIHFYFS